MRWLFGAKRLRRRGVIGINRRNADFIAAQNPRSLFPLVDDKLRMRALCRRIGVPTPEVYAVLRSHAQLRHLPDLLAEFGDVVLKPNRGSAGRGILVLLGKADTEGRHFVRPDDSFISAEEICQHAAEVLAGLYSLGGQPDAVLLQRRVRPHPDFARISLRGIPDVRVLLYRGEPAMAMLRLPTLASNGRANLHQGGVGVGIDLATGLTTTALQGSRAVTHHPDTGEPLRDRPVRPWSEILEMSRKVARAVGLGYLGVDIVLDPEEGPMLLEANARPGLAIQLANRTGLARRLAEIDEGAERV
ncbi:MAG TPA: alpha-L-glutamate ligase-like protein [Gemmataceae bacterium]